MQANKSLYDPIAQPVPKLEQFEKNDQLMSFKFGTIFPTKISQKFANVIYVVFKYF